MKNLARQPMFSSVPIAGGLKCLTQETYDFFCVSYVFGEKFGLVVLFVTLAEVVESLLKKLLGGRLYPNDPGHYGHLLVVEMAKSH